MFIVVALVIQVEDVRALGRQIGQEVGVSEWIEITQERIDRFAEATEDRQWIHVDRVRARGESPFKTTIAHGFLTLSLASFLIRRTFVFSRTRMTINYGLNRLRFVAPVPAGSRVRGRFSPMLVEEAGGGVQVTWAITIELEGATKPCCVAEWILRYYELEPSE